MDISDWSDLRQFDSGGNFSFNSNNTIQEDNEQKMGSKETSNDGPHNSGEQQQQPQTGEVKEEIGFSSGFEVSDWNDLRKFDDDHDDEWFKYQEKLMTEQYGGNFIKVKYSDNGRVAYYCELCFAECNAKKSLELHCNGMKHLKKKDMWEKEGKPAPLVSCASGENGKPKGPPKSESSRDRKRTRSPLPPSMRKRLSPQRGRQGDHAGYPYNQREPHRGYKDDYGREVPPPYDSRYNYDRDRDYYGHDDRDRYGPQPPPFDRPDSRTRRSPSLSRYSPKRDRGFSPVTRRDYDHGREKRYPDFEERRSSPRRPRYYGDKRSKSPERKRSPYGSKRDRSRSPKRSSIATPPSPPKISASRYDEVEKKNLAGSPAGSLLQKLAECCVKSSEDADLALNVVAALSKSLKEYCQRNQETKLAELLMEAELKIGTVKALKAGMKMLSNFTADATSSTNSPMNVFPNYLGVSRPPAPPRQPPPTAYPGYNY